MSLNYNIIETLKLLLNSFKYDIFICIIVSSILFTVALIINRNKKRINYLILCINILLIILIGYYYMESILTFKFSNIINNMYFYFFNSIVYLIIMTILCFKTKYKKLNYVFYGICLINLLYSLFMTYYLDNIELIVIGNIYPMIKFGNMGYISYYLVTLFIIIRRFLTKKI